MKRKLSTTSTKSVNAPAFKKFKVALDSQRLRTEAGTLHFSDFSSEVDLDASTKLMDHVLMIKSTKKDTIVLTKSGSVYVFCGEDRRELKELKFPGKAILITAGIEHAACLLDDGRAYIWGSFESPAYGFRDEYVPVPILPNEHTIDLASGRDHLLALTSEGVVYSLGCGEHGQLGRVPKRSSLDGGRRGVKLLLQPGLVHKKHHHLVDRIWATGNSSFYRDSNTKSVFGFGQNIVTAAKDKLAVDHQFKPVLTMFTDTQIIGEELALTQSGELLAKKNQWKKVKSEGVSDLLCGHRNHFLVHNSGHLSEWKNGKTQAIDVTVNGRKEAVVLDATRVGESIFLVIA